MGETAVLGIDLGTSRAKAVAYDNMGRPLGSGDGELQLRSDGNRVEQDPDHVVEAAVDAAAQAVAEARAQGARVVGVGLSSAMHSLLAVDADGEPLTPALVYADTRAATQAAELARVDPLLAVRTGTPLHPMSPVAKLRWFAESCPQVAERAARWLSLKEYLLLRLCGEAVVDHSVASATGLLELGANDWDPRALELAGVDRAALSPLVPPTTVVGPLVPAWADRLRLPVDIPIVVGVSDGAASNLGVGAVDVGTAALAIGTSGAIRTVTRTPRTDPEGRLFCYSLLGDRWILGGPVNNGGVVLRWARDGLLPELAQSARRDGEDPYKRFDTLAAAVPSGADGLLFLPYLLGERAPLWDPAPRGVLFGLAAHHTRSHVLRALLEGVAYQLATVARLVEEHAQRLDVVRADGGFTASPLWLQIVADVLDRRIEVPRTSEAATLGAALLARQALGSGDAVELARRLVTIDAVVEPDRGAARVHARLLPLFVQVRDRLLDSFHELAALRSAPADDVAAPAGRPI